MSGFVVAVAALITRPVSTLTRPEWPADGERLVPGDEGLRVLSLRRAMTKDASPGVWETLSGRIEIGEQPQAALMREILEESGLIVEIDQRPMAAYHAWRIDQPMIVIQYRARWVSGEVRLSDEHDAWAWLDAQGFAARCPIPELVHAVDSVLREPVLY